MAVTLGAPHRQTQEHRAGRVDLVEHRFVAQVGVEHRVAMKSTGDHLLGAGSRQQVAGDLFDDELVERQVAVDARRRPSRDSARRCAARRTRSRCCRRSGPGRANAAPSARRSGATPTADRPALVGVRAASRRRKPTTPRRRRQPGQIERQLAESASPDRPRRPARCARASRRASTKASIGLHGQSRRFTAGTAGGSGRLNAQ